MNLKENQKEYIVIFSILLLSLLLSLVVRISFIDLLPDAFIITLLFLYKKHYPLILIGGLLIQLFVVALSYGFIWLVYFNLMVSSLIYILVAMLSIYLKDIKIPVVLGTNFLLLFVLEILRLRDRKSVV